MPCTQYTQRQRQRLTEIEIDMDVDRDIGHVSIFHSSTVHCSESMRATHRHQVDQKCTAQQHRLLLLAADPTRTHILQVPAPYNLCVTYVCTLSMQHVYVLVPYVLCGGASTCPRTTARPCAANWHEAMASGLLARFGCRMPTGPSVGTGTQPIGRAQVRIVQRSVNTDLYRLHLAPWLHD